VGQQVTPQQYDAAQQRFWGEYRRLAWAATRGGKHAAQQSAAIDRYMAWFRAEQASAGNSK
jgi:hypothetical protein